ncbi:MAG: N-acetylglucosaminyl-diphospho-decaprenol L-rhamnosyltransferase [Motiliproteus sp.]|jgi:N-acetylglucosaminyl-diphospho-decaprenol L-rhamnosyltransferase
MAFFLSVVSHEHDKYIESNLELLELSRMAGVTVVIRDNVGSDRLAIFAQTQAIDYFSAVSPSGFGANNNAVFDYCRSELGMQSSDYFCLLNPDLFIAPDVLLACVAEAQRRHARLVTINLFEDFDYSHPDLNIKRFPSLLDFAKGFLLGTNPAAYDKSLLTESCVVDWASGAFLLFRADLYEQLDGFDERFFMYLEDVDICRRAREHCAEELLYLPQLKAVHLCEQANKKLFSKHFIWFLTSMTRYFLKHGWKAPTARL